MAEFFNDQARDGYLAGLERELDGYEARRKQAQAVGNTAGVKLMDARIKQVKDEISRVKGEVSKEEPADDAGEADGKGGGGEKS